jgi:cobalamin-dependent methionine synthase I
VRFFLAVFLNSFFSSQNQLLSSLIEPTIDWVKNFGEMGKVEKLSPSPTYSKSGSKRSKMIVKALKRTDENATRQHASENTATKMDETVDTNEETSETDENWQTITNQRSNKFRKTDTHAPTTAMSFFGQKVPQDLPTNGVHSYFSFGGNDVRNKPTFHQHALDKSSPGGLSSYTGGRRKES